MRLDIGLRDPYFSRQHHQNRYTQPPSNVYCTSSASMAAAKTAGDAVPPFKIHTSYNKLLPNVGVTYKLHDVSSLFAYFTSALNAPVNDDLYSVAVIGSGTTPMRSARIMSKPETSQTYEGGYRYQTARSM